LGYWRASDLATCKADWMLSASKIVGIIAKKEDRVGGGERFI
jgi:hypothetical protein